MQSAAFAFVSRISCGKRRPSRSGHPPRPVTHKRKQASASAELQRGWKRRAWRLLFRPPHPSSLPTVSSGTPHGCGLVGWSLPVFSASGATDSHHKCTVDRELQQPRNSPTAVYGMGAILARHECQHDYFQIPVRVFCRPAYGRLPHRARSFDLPPGCRQKGSGPRLRQWCALWRLVRSRF